MVEGRVHTRNTLDRSGGSSADGTVSRVTSTFELSKHGLPAPACYALGWCAPLHAAESEQLLGVPRTWTMTWPSPLLPLGRR